MDDSALEHQNDHEIILSKSATSGYYPVLGWLQRQYISAFLSIQPLKTLLDIFYFNSSCRQFSTLIYTQLTGTKSGGQECDFCRNESVI